MRNDPETLEVRVQFSRTVNNTVTFEKIACNDYGTVYVNMEHHKFHIIGNKVKCLVTLAKDMVNPENRIAAIALFAMLTAFEEA